MLAGTRWILSDRMESGEVDWLGLVTDCQRLIKDRHWLFPGSKGDISLMGCRNSCFLNKPSIDIHS